MDRKLYKMPFQGELPPSWICPTCGKGVLKVKKGTFHSTETSGSEKAHGHPDWEPEWIQYVYTCLLECTNPSCKESVANSGEGGVDEFIDEDEEGRPFQDWKDFFRPKYFHPPLKLFTLHKDTPEKVTKEVEQSFELFFCNPDSALNHIRIALEELLTFLKIKRFENRDGTRYPISLHKRITLLPAKYNKIVELSKAIKWLGNAGSHSGKDLTLDDVMDAYELMDVVLKEVYDNQQQKAKKLAKKIIKKKGPTN